MWENVVPEVFPPRLQAALHRTVDLLDERPLHSLDDPVAEHLSDAELLITSWGAVHVDEALLARAPRLRGVFHAAGSVKSVMGEAAWRAGLDVTSAVRIGAAPVIDYTVAMVMLSAHRALPLAQEYRVAGFPAVRGRRGRFGLRIGVVGASAIGRGVIQRLVADGWDVAVYDPVVDPALVQALGARQLELDELCAHSDILTLHAPSLPATRGMIDARRLALLPDGATLINTARGALVDHDALRAECLSGRLDAVLDVTEPEPLEPGDVLLSLPNVVCTPHAAGVQGSEIGEMGAFILEEVQRYRAGQPLTGAVDPGLLPTLA